MAVFALGGAGCTLVTSLTDLDSSFDAPTDGVGDHADTADPGDVRVERVEDAALDSRLCQMSAHALCDDFDDGPLGTSPTWTREQTTHGMELTLATDYFVSSPRALSVTMPTDVGQPDVEAVLESDLPGAVAAVDCSFRLRIAASGSRGSAVPLSIYLAADPDSGYIGTDIQFVVSQRMTVLIQKDALDDLNSTKEQYALDATAPPPSWFDVRLRVERGPQARVNVWLGGALVGEIASSIPSTELQTVRVGLGHGVPGNVPWRLLIDDVRCDRE